MLKHVLNGMKTFSVEAKVCSFLCLRYPGSYSPYQLYSSMNRVMYNGESLKVSLGDLGASPLRLPCQEVEDSHADCIQNIAHK